MGVAAGIDFAIEGVADGAAAGGVGFGLGFALDGIFGALGFRLCRVGLTPLGAAVGEVCGLPGRNSNSSPQATQVLMGKAIRKIW